MLRISATNVGEAFTLFDAADAKWVVPFPYAKEEFGVEEEAYFTDGPCLRIMEDGRLYMTWSSWGRQNEYAVGVAVSDNASLRGPGARSMRHCSRLTADMACFYRL